MSSLVRRTPALFSWRAADGLGANGKLVARSYAKELEGVLSRTSTKWVVDRNGLLVPRVHSLAPLTVIGGVEHLLLEPAATNLCLRSQEFDNGWSLGTGISVSTNATAAPDGTTTADLLTDDGSVGSAGVSRACGFTGDGEKALSVYLKPGTASFTEIALFDSTAATTRHRARITWSTLAVTTVTGSGMLYALELLVNGWYRLRISVVGVVAANTNTFFVYPTGTPIGAGTVYAWGAQVEDAVVPSSYIPTTSATATRNADSLYFPFAAVPQELTAYVKQVNVGNFANTGAVKRFLHIGAENVSTDARFAVYGSAGGTAAAGLYDDGTTQVTDAGAIISPVLGDTVESRTVLSSSWTIRTHASKNGAAEVSGAASSASGSAASWAAGVNRLYLAGNSEANVMSAISHVVVAAGTKTMDEMRALAGVG